MTSKRIAAASVGLALALAPRGAFAANPDDYSVTSIKIRAADGTSGQVLTTGAGVKTGHIQNSAVTTPKLADGAVTSAKLQDGTVATADLANGAVTDAKISGPISASKIASTGLNADTVDGRHAAEFAPAAHTHDPLYQRRHANVIVVAKSGGDFSDPAAAVASIADASATNPYLVKIMPGVYDLGSGSIALKAFVDLEGSGESVTTIQGGGASEDAYGTIWCQGNNGIRDLTVKATGTNSSLAAIRFLREGSGEVRIARVTAVGSNSSGAGVASGIFLALDAVLRDVTARAETPCAGNFAVGVNGSKALLENVRAIAANGSTTVAIDASAGSSEMRSVTATSSGIGMRAMGGAARIEHSRIEGAVSLLIWQGASAMVGYSELTGAFENTGTLKCFSVHDASYDPVVCP